MPGSEADGGWFVSCAGEDEPPSAVRYFELAGCDSLDERCAFLRPTVP
jgi:hypothetical protein